MASTTLYVSEIYTLVNKMIKSDPSSSVDQKAEAVNLGYRYLLEKMINEAGGIDELLVSGYWAPASDSVNYATGPQSYAGAGAYNTTNNYQFLKAQMIYGQISGDATANPPTAKYQSFAQSKNIDFDVLSDSITDTNYLGYPELTGTRTSEVEQFAWKGDQIHFDRVLSLGSSTKFLVKFWTLPTQLYLFDSTAISGALLALLVQGDTIVGSSSNASATIYSSSISLPAPYSSDNIAVYKASITGTFQNGETITSPQHGVSSATIVAPFNSLTEQVEVPEKYKYMLATAIAAVYFDLKRLPDEAAVMDAKLDAMVKDFKFIKMNRKNLFVAARRRRA